MGMEVNKLSTADMATSYRRLSNANADAVQLSTIHLEHGPHEEAAEASTGSTGELSGIYFGILNSKSSSNTNILTTTLVPPFAVASIIWHETNLLTHTNSLPDNTAVHRLIHQHRRLQHPRAGQEPGARDRRPPQRAPLHHRPQRNLRVPVYRGHRRVRRLRGHQEAEVYALSHGVKSRWMGGGVERYARRLRRGTPCFLLLESGEGDFYVKLLWVWQDTYVMRRAVTHSKAQAKRAAARIVYRGKLGSKAYGSYRERYLFFLFCLCLPASFVLQFLFQVRGRLYRLGGVQIPKAG